MKVSSRAIEIKKTHLRRLIQCYGLQPNLFDRSMLDLSWEGLEYSFFAHENQLMLHRIKLEMDFPIGKYGDLVENNIWPTREGKW